MQFQYALFFKWSLIGSRTAIIMQYTPTRLKGPLFYPNVLFYRFLKHFRM